VNRLTP